MSGAVLELAGIASSTACVHFWFSLEKYAVIVEIDRETLSSGRPAIVHRLAPAHLATTRPQYHKELSAR